MAFIYYDQPVWDNPSIKEALDFSDQSNSDNLLVLSIWGDEIRNLTHLYKGITDYVINHETG